MDTANKFFVGMQGDDIVFVKPVPQRLAPEDALNLAAWIVALANVDGTFKTLLDEVLNT